MQRLEAIQPRHLHIQQHKVGLVVAHLLQRLVAVVGLQRQVTFQIQVHFDKPDHARFVIDDKYGLLRLIGHEWLLFESDFLYVWRTFLLLLLLYHYDTFSVAAGTA